MDVEHFFVPSTIALRDSERKGRVVFVSALVLKSVIFQKNSTEYFWADDFVR